MVCARESNSQSGSEGVYEPVIDPEVQELFEDFDSLHFPEMQSEPPPEKSLKERILEQHRERVRAIKAHEKRFSEESYIPDTVFMRRNANDLSSHNTNIVSKTNVFREDLESCDTSSKPDLRLSETHLHQSNFEKLHEPRRGVSWSKSTKEVFALNSQDMNDKMDEMEISRFPNTEKRFKKLKSVNLHLKRYSAEEIRARYKKGKVDLFDYFSLLKNTFVKSEKSSIERKRDVLCRYSDLVDDFDYSKRPGAEERAEYFILTQRKEELEELLENINRDDIPSCSADAPEAQMCLKRKHSVSVDEEIDVPAKRTEKDKRLSSESMKTNNEFSKPPEIEGLTLEEARKERERRREAHLKREQVALEKQKREAEEHQKKQNAEMEEFAKRQEERKRIQAEQEKQKEEELRIAEEKRKLLMEEEEKRRKRKEAERLRKEREEEAYELERMRLEIERCQNSLNSTPAVPAVPAVPSQPKLVVASSYLSFKCKLPANWTVKKDQFLTKYKWPIDRAHCDLERSEAVSRAIAISSERPVIIPPVNNATTRVFPLRRPSRPSAAAPVFKVPAPPVRRNRMAMLTKNLNKVAAEIKILTKKSRNLTPMSMSLSLREIDYKIIGLDRLKMNYLYPFRQSDGMYWPVFYGLRNTTTPGHVKALATCKSFSGKHASYHLLTTSKEDDTRKKKFEMAYHDSSGDWADYSRKPGRFSNRIGYKAHFNRCKDGFEIQRKRARDKLRNEYARERKDESDFGNAMQQYGGRGNNYNRQLTLHLSELVRDARLDIYSLKQKLQGFDDRVLHHPGTRENPLEIWWSAHGYRIYLNTRDWEYGCFMERFCADYERLLPSRYSHIDRFSDWCFSPMLASLYYQAKYSPYDILNRETMKALRQRKTRYHALTNTRKFHFKEAYDLCRLTNADKKQWTILHDQLVSHFRDFPTISQIMFDEKGNMIAKADNIINELMKTVFKDYANFWDYLQTPPPKTQLKSIR
uniref:Reticulocyte-binding protein 2 homolog a n=1 Tax=Caenorhabditis tropicalis TaxID=1561998 RepID=A0A1I7TIT5_9PELO